MTISKNFRGEVKQRPAYIPLRLFKPAVFTGRKGRKIRSIEDLMKQSGRSVIGLPWGRPQPVAWLISMQVHFVFHAIQRGLWRYEPRKKS